MKIIKCEIKGISPLLINRFCDESLENPDGIKKANKDYGSPREQAEKTAYQDEDGKLWIPSTWIKGSMTTLSSDYKLKRTKKSLKAVIGGAVILAEDKIYFSEKISIKDIEIYSCPVVIQRARIMRHRAKIESWSLGFTLEIDDEIVPVEVINKLLVDAGRRAGIGDFRPQKSGSFGRYVVSKFKEHVGK